MVRAPVLPVLFLQFAEITSGIPALNTAFLNIRAERVSSSTLVPGITRAITALDPDL